MLLLIDNYDSFTYNLVQYFEILGETVIVLTQDEANPTRVHALKPEKIVISPGPKGPAEAGYSLTILKHFHKTTPILGVCLGHQCIALQFGGTIIQAPRILHGKTSVITHQNQRLFQSIPNPFRVMRYHSLAVSESTLPPCFFIDASAEDGTIMAISHQTSPIFGVQFHPESILSEHGLKLLKNFLIIADDFYQQLSPYNLQISSSDPYHELS